MAHISNQKLKNEVLKQVHSRLAQSVAKIQTTNQASQFLEELLGEEELLMLAKRVAVVYMLAEDISAYRIAHTLGMSTSTVNRMQEHYDRGGYSTIAAQYLHKKNRSAMWDDIDKLLRLGMPHYSKKGRWRWLYELEKKRR